MQREYPGWSRPLHPLLQERCEYLIDESPRLRDDAVAKEERQWRAEEERDGKDSQCSQSCVS